MCDKVWVWSDLATVDANPVPAKCLLNAVAFSPMTGSYMSSWVWFAAALSANAASRPVTSVVSWAWTVVAFASSSACRPVISVGS